MNVRCSMLVCACFVCLAACSKAPATAGPHATITLRDGRTLQGAVQSSSAAQIQILGDDGVTQTIPMDQVRTVDYGASASTVAPTPSDADGDHDHDNHFHAGPAMVTTRTFEIPAGACGPGAHGGTIDSAARLKGPNPTRPKSPATSATRRRLRHPARLERPNSDPASKGGHFPRGIDLVIDLPQSPSAAKAIASEAATSPRKATRAWEGISAQPNSRAAAELSELSSARSPAEEGRDRSQSGAGAGILTEILTKGKIKVPAESVLTFRLEAPLTIVAAQ